MKWFLLFLALVPASPSSLQAQIVQYLPACTWGNGYDADHDGTIDSGCPEAATFATEGTGYAVQVESGVMAGTMHAVSDANADGSSAVETAFGSIHLGGQIRFITPSLPAGTYTTWVRLSAPNTGKTYVYLSDAPMYYLPSQTTEQTEICSTNATLCTNGVVPGYGWAKLTPTVNGGAARTLYLASSDTIRLDCIYLDTNVNASPVCPSASQTPSFDYEVYKAGSPPANCAALSGAGSVSWANSYGDGGAGTPTVQMAWLSGSPDKGYICVTYVDADIQAVTSADDDDNIFGDDYFELRATPTLTATMVNSIIYAFNARSTPATWDGKYDVTLGDVSTPDYNMSCTKSGSWSVFCSFDFDWNVTNDSFGLAQMRLLDVDTGPVYGQRIWSGNGINQLNTPSVFKVIKYSSTALPAPPGDTTPPSVGVVSFSNVGTNQFTASAAVTDAESTITGAQLYYDTDSGLQYCLHVPAPCPIPISGGQIQNGVASATITGLNQGTTYYAAMRATSAGGTTTDAALIATENNQITGTPTTCNYYASSSAGAGHTGTIGDPFRVVDFWSVGNLPGKILCLTTGIYTGANFMIAPPDGTSGTSVAHITIKSEVDGGAQINGQGSNVPVSIGTGTKYIDLSGFDAYNGPPRNGGVGVIALSHADNITFKRICAWDAYQTPTASDPNQTSNNVIWQFNYSTNIVAEDICFFGTGRKGLYHFSSNGPIVVRRAWGMNNGSRAWDVDGGAPEQTYSISYHAANATFENVIGTFDSPKNVGITSVFSTDWNDLGANDCVNWKYLGSIGYVKPGQSGVNNLMLGVGWTERSQDCWEWKDVVLMAVGMTPRWIAEMDPFAPDDGGTCATEPGGVCNRKLTNVTTIGGFSEPTGPNITGGATLSNFVYGATRNNVPSVWNGSGGANVCYQYLNGNLTSTKLWPWPMDARINQALTRSGRTPANVFAGAAGTGYAANTVTSQMVALFGAIPAGCIQ